MKFLCLGYADEKKWEALSKGEQDAMMEECFAYDDVLRKNGHSWAEGGEALQSSRTAKTLRWKGGKVVVTDGPYAETKEQLGGFGVLEARDMNEAIELMLKHPGVRFGPFEIRPADETNPECSTPGAAPANTKEETEKFLCLGYMEEKKWDVMSKSEQEAFMKECLAYDDMLRKNGNWVGGEALQYVRTAKTLRWKDGKALVTDGPYAETKEQLGGVVVLAAKDLNHAVELMSKHPGVRLGVHLEIRPADEEINALIEARQNQSRR